MLMVLFYDGNERYVIDCKYIAKILPKIEVRNMPHVPSWVYGIMTYRDNTIPVIDFCRLVSNDHPCDSNMASRIILFAYKAKDGSEYQIGLLAEKITETRVYQESDFIENKLKIKECPFLKGILNDNEGTIHLVESEELLEYIINVLFTKK